MLTKLLALALGTGLTLASVPPILAQENPKPTQTQKTLEQKLELNQIQFTPFSLAYNSSDSLAGVYWSPSDLTNYSTPDTLLAINQYLKNKGVRYIALDPEDLSHLKYLRPFCQDKPTLLELTKDFNITQALKSATRDYKKNLASGIKPTELSEEELSDILFNWLNTDPNKLPLTFPTEEYLGNEFRLALKYKKEEEFLTKLKRYVQELSRLMLELGSNTNLHLDIENFAEPFRKHPLDNSNPLEYAAFLASEWLQATPPEIYTRLQFQPQNAPYFQRVQELQLK